MAAEVWRSRSILLFLTPELHPPRSPVAALLVARYLVLHHVIDTFCPKEGGQRPHKGRPTIDWLFSH